MTSATPNRPLPNGDEDMHAPHPSKVVAVKTLAWVLVAVSAYDGAGFLASGDEINTSDTYAALSLVPYGMKAWGFLLLAGSVAVAWGIGRDDRGHPYALNTTLAIGFGYYFLWSFVLVATWLWLGYIPAVEALSKSLVLCILYLVCARAVAPHGHTWADWALHRLKPTRTDRERG